MTKPKIIFGLLTILVLAVSSISAQEFTLTTTPANIISSKASIDMPGLSGNPLAIIVATPLGNTALLNTHPIGAWYYSGKWNIFNTDQGAGAHLRPIPRRRELESPIPSRQKSRPPKSRRRRTFVLPELS